MMEEWKEVTLGEIVDLKQGFAVNKKSKHHISETSTKYPLLKISDLFDGTETLFVKDTIPSQFLVEPHEIIYSRTGQVGYAFMGRKGVVYNNCFKVIPNSKVDSIFLFHLLNSAPVRELAKVLATGAAQPDLNHGAFKSIKIILPPLPIQRRIASILSAYDDLIENNLKRIKLLEEKAQLTYEEWFVRMRFPGHEKVKIDKESGLPQGWKKGKIVDLLELQRGFDLPIHKRLKGSVPVYASTGIIDMHNESKVKAPGVVTGRSGTLGQVQYIQSDYWPLNTTLWVKKFNKATPIFAFHFLSYFNLERFGGGSAVPSLDRKVVHSQRIKIPPSHIIDKFEDVCNPIMNNINIIQNQNHHLKEGRDILLPRLMTGMIDVDKLKLESEEDYLMVKNVCTTDFND